MRGQISADHLFVVQGQVCRMDAECRVISNVRVHWFCAGLQDDDPAPEGEWHCPDCKHKIASGKLTMWLSKTVVQVLSLGTLRHTIEPAEQTKCLRANCLLR